jgi:hypothetical protein
MTRFLAMVNVPGITEERFREALDQVRKWRIDPRHTVVRAVCCLGDRKVLVECEGVEQAVFERWLQERGWKPEVVHRVDLVHEGGYIWKV